MTLRDVRRLMQLLAKASPEQQQRILSQMTPMDLLTIDADFEGWAARGQLAPPGEGWRVWLMMAGRGFGKTRAGAEWIHRLASGRKPLRIALVGATIEEARKIMVEGVSGILSVAGRNQRRVKWEPSLGRLKWRGGSEAQLFSGDNADGLRGPEHHVAWCAADRRRAPGRSGRGASAGFAAAFARGGFMLHRRKRSDRRMGRKGAPDRRL